jgi:hypothetical protein
MRMTRGMMMTARVSLACTRSMVLSSGLMAPWHALSAVNRSRRAITMSCAMSNQA